MIRLVIASGLVLVVMGCSALEVGDPFTTPGSPASTTVPAVSTTSASTTSVPTTTTTTTPPARFDGVVVSDEGVPVRGVVVQIGDVSTVGGSDGTFVLESVGGGLISVSKPGWVGVEVSWDGTDVVSTIEMSRRTIRGLHIAGSAAGSDEAFTDLLELAADTAVNAFVFDTKQEGGTVLYDTSVSEAHDIGAVDVTYDAASRVAQAHYAGLYTITRIVTFEDRHRANARPEEKFAGPWVDPRSQAARDYNIALGVEACSLGFDEIQYDYVRFPSGKTARASGQLDLTQSERVGAISGFLAEAREQLEPMGCAVSADIFGIVVSTPDDQGLGQRPEELSEQLDAISPMVYPSHYSLGWLGYADPNDYPYEVTANAIEAALPRLSPGTALRPWLQSFWWTNAQIREAIQAAEDRGVGWMMWNVVSNFDKSALPTDDEVGD
ncbi:MAG: putative glycoside hydrolase [Actinomycetota bacterium]|nr:putative glycoside hydrolase [Actinomycetota bacterium]